MAFFMPFDTPRRLRSSSTTGIDMEVPLVAPHHFEQALGPICRRGISVMSARPLLVLPHPSQDRLRLLRSDIGRQLHPLALEQVEGMRGAGLVGLAQD